MLNYHGHETEKEEDAVAKVTGKKFLVKRSKYGHFFNDNNMWHHQAMRSTDMYPYLFVTVPQYVYELYVKFLSTKNDYYLRKAERLYNEN